MATGTQLQRPTVRRTGRRLPPAVAIAALLAAVIAVLVGPAGAASDAAAGAGDEPAGFFAVIEPAEVAKLISGLSGIEAKASEPASLPRTAGHQEPLVVTLHFEPGGRHYYLISVAQAPGGALFEQAVDDNEIDPASDRGPSPDAAIFARLQDIPASAGPGGSTFGVLFTTCDGRFDVRIIASQNLPSGFSGQSVDIHLLAQRLAGDYSAMSC